MHLQQPSDSPDRTVVAAEYIEEARGIIRNCVHCGFCTTHCPTYRLFGDDRDSPRGRIYLIKSMLEGNKVGTETQTHLDRCLHCRACESVCPSGVAYGRLLEIGRKVLAVKVPRSLPSRAWRRLLCIILPYRSRFSVLWRLAQWCRLLLPLAAMKRRIPASSPQISPRSKNLSQNLYSRRVLLLRGCVQSVLSPEINVAAQNVLHHAGIQAIELPEEQCCGALHYHASDEMRAQKLARHNIAVWWPHVAAGVDAIVSTASGCGAMLREYSTLLAKDTEYADKSKHIASICCDIAELLGEEEKQKILSQITPDAARIACHCPCTLQHAQRLPSLLPELLTALGAPLVATRNPALCCGQAGTYSLLQPQIADTLRTNKLADLMIAKPDRILTANIGCLHHLRAASSIPVQHWIEWLDEHLARESANA